MPRPPQRSRPARLTRRDALGLAAAVALGGLATGAAHTTAAAGPQEAPWAAALTAAIDALLPRTTIVGAIVGVWQEGQPDYVRAFGVQDTATGA